MERRWTLVSAGLGAGLMYLLDPDRGRRRRALLRDKLGHLAHEARRGLGLATHDLANRSRGVVAETRHRITGGRAPDEVLEERVRARIGHVVSHPHAIRVRASRGRIELTGVILAHELASCIEAVEGVPGVRGLELSLEAHESPDIPALAGGLPRPVPRAKRHPSPGAHLLRGAGALAFALIGMRRGGLLGRGLRTAGLATLAGELGAQDVLREVLDEIFPRRPREKAGEPEA
jgi:hypothetical protein